MKLGKETGNVMNWMMSGSQSMPKAGEDGTELCWTDRRSFKVLSYDDKKKCGTLAFYVDCYDAHTPVGTELTNEVLNFKFAYKKWRIEYIDCMDRKKYVPFNCIFGVRNGFYDLSF